MNNIAMSPAAGDRIFGPLSRLRPSRARRRSLMMWTTGPTPVVPSLGEDGPREAARKECSFAPLRPA